MTTEEAKRRAELYLALAEGKTIQAQNPSGGEWFDVKIETLRSICEEINYRIKPEPKYRPFETQEECWNEMHKHPDFGWVLCDGVYLHLLDVYCDATHTNEQHDGIDYDDALGELTFTDGTPFGIKEE